MTDKIDHRAAVKDAAHMTNPASMGLTISRLADAYLASVKASWPGEVPKDKKRQMNGTWSHRDNYCNEIGMAWCFDADKFEDTYNIKVDDPWLVQVMENVR